MLHTLASGFLPDLGDFINRHRTCGRFIGDAATSDTTGYVLKIACCCGVIYVRWVSSEEDVAVTPGIEQLQPPLYSIT